MKLRTFGLAATLAASVAAVALLPLVSSYAAPIGTDFVGRSVDNFVLSDQTGFGHELTYYKDATAIVLVAYTANDPTSAKAFEAVRKLKSTFAGKKVEFMMLDSTATTGPRKFDGELGAAEIPILSDELQLVGRSLGVTTTGEAFVINPKGWKIAYHGPIDGTFSSNAEKDANIAAAVSAMLDGKSPTTTKASVVGKAIDFPDRKNEASFSKISYAKEVAPILTEKCVTCHAPNGMAPFAMNSYEVVKSFSPMIREALRTKRMPPFHADNHGAVWANDSRPSSQQIKTLINWIEAGSPRGEGADPLLTAASAPAPMWPKGEPDLIVALPEYDVPASGSIDWLPKSVPSTLTEGKWVKEVAWANVSPAVHHSLAGWIKDVPKNGDVFGWDPAMGGYVPGGAPSFTTPANTGVYIPPGGSWSYQMHYSAVGKPIRDKSLAGYYFYKDNEKPDKILRQAVIADNSMDIKAGQARYHETAYVTFPADAELFGIQPHCHDRCVATQLTMRLPDGTERVLLNQAKYDFGWQRQYDLKELIKVPKGTMFIADYIYDNSARNRHNPDPKVDVAWGQQSWEEMLNTFLRYRFVEETASNPRPDLDLLVGLSANFGSFDDDRDGEIVQADLKLDRMLGRIKNYWAVGDVDKNGKLNVQEFGVALAAMRKAGSARATAADAN